LTWKYLSYFHVRSIIDFPLAKIALPQAFGVYSIFKNVHKMA